METALIASSLVLAPPHDHHHNARYFAEVVVSDTGHGHFSKAKGMGMGLSIDRTFVEGHGGPMWAESKNGNGAVFHVRLPLVRT